MRSDVGLGGDSHEIQGPVTIRLSLIEMWWVSGCLQMSSADDPRRRIRAVDGNGMEWTVKLNV